MVVVLVAPRNPLNIGAVARAMANFGFTHLAVVAPYSPHWREARSAVGAPDLLQNARECATLADALKNCTLVFGTGTLTHRKPEQPVVRLPELARAMTPEVYRGGQIAVVFGPEKHGLTREDLSWCHALIEIPTDPRQPSMNLGQAVAVTLYEVATRVLPNAGAVRPAHAEGIRANAEALDRLGSLIEETMTSAGYSPRTMQPANRHDLRLFLRRLALSPVDVRRIMGLFRRILHRLGRYDTGGETSPSSFNKP